MFKSCTEKVIDLIPSLINRTSHLTWLILSIIQLSYGNQYQVPD